MKAEATEEHAHDEHQLLMVTDGLMLFEDREQRHVLSGKHAAFVPQGLLHRAETLSLSQELSFVSLYFQPSSFQGLLGSLSPSLPNTIVVFPASSLLTASLQRLCKTPEAPLTSELQRATLRLLYLLLLDEVRQPGPLSLPQSREPRMATILSWLEEHFELDIVLDDLEKNFAASKRTIQRWFQRECGMNFSEYLRLRRIFEAHVLLSTTKRSVLDVALSVGYESMSAFYSAFARVTGKTPGEIRRRQHQ